MKETKPLTLLIVDDNPLECLKFKEEAKQTPEIEIIGVTSSSYEAITLAERYRPEAIVLDLELHHGLGSGIHFLNELPNSLVSHEPFIFLTTNVVAEVVLKVAREAGVTWMFSKAQQDYSAKMVFDMALQFRRAKASLVQRRGCQEERGVSECPEREREFILKRVEHELDLIGVSRALKGRYYLVEGICFLVGIGTDLNLRKGTAVDYLSKRYNRNGSALTRTMQTAIRSAWKKSKPEDLMVHYTDRVSYQTGVPATSEFLRYYAKKIRRSL